MQSRLVGLYYTRGKRMKKDMQDYMVTFIIRSVEEINKTLENKLPIEMREDCSLFGGEGVLDSISLVSLIVSVEQRIEDVLGVSIILANEKAMSRRNSPFLTVGTLAEFCNELVKEEEAR